VNRKFKNLTKLAAELELPEPDNPVWEIGHSDFVKEICTKFIQYTFRHFINKASYNNNLENPKK
jgi:hypothetical protein